MKYIKNYKTFENKETSMLDKYVGTPLFCFRDDAWGSLDCSIFTDKNVAGYGCGLRGDFFNEREFVNALSRIGDSLNRHLFEINELDEIAKKLRIYGKSKEETIDKIVDKVEKTRKSYCSANPDGDREAGVFIELDELRKLLMENN